MRSIYTSAWAFFSKHWLLLLFAALLMEVLPHIFKSSAIGGQTGALAIIAYSMHRFVLFGEEFSRWKPKRDSTPRKQQIGWFMLASGTMAVCWIGIVGGFALWQTYQTIDNNVIFGLMLIVALLFQFLLLVIFGTALPAAAAGDRFGPITTLRRAWRTALPIAGGLLVGPVLTAIPLLILVFKAVTVVDDLGTGPAGEIAIGTLARMGGFFLTALAVAVLCRAYLKVAPPGITDQIPA